MNLSRIIISQCHDPAYNLAFEEYLVDKSFPLLFLWQNEPTVVIGRNQNPYRECNLKEIEKDKVHLIRRRSGGGAVFHDLGNLNFTLITHKSPDCIEKNFAFTVDVLQSLGIEAQISGRNDIEFRGKKISGNAFFENDNIFCQHGTLLISSDLKKLSAYLTASKLKLEAKGIESVRSRVANLNEFVTNITPSDVISAFCKKLNCECDSIDSISMESIDEVKALIQKYNSWEWIYGESPKYNMYFEKRFKSGIIGAELFIESGIINNCRISSDSLIEESLNTFSKALIGKSFKLNSVNNIIISNIKNEQTQKDIKELFEQVLTTKSSLSKTKLKAD